MKKTTLPYLCVFLICFITFNLWVLSKESLTTALNQPLPLISQITALLGTVLLSSTLVLTTRLKFLESVFGGLDRVYLAHRILGSLAFVYLIIHPFTLAVQAFPSTNVSLLYLLPGSDLAYNLGIIGLYLMLISFIFMVFIKLPHHLWKFSHRALGISFLLGGVHALLIPSDISAFLPLRLWIGTFLTIGLASLIYTVFFYKIFGPKYLYRVAKIDRVLDVVNIYLEPSGTKTIHFDPGQFVYVKFRNPQVGPETHPFSISSAPQDPFLRLSVKIVGDYTLKIPNLRPGDKAVIFGPHGEFKATAAPDQNVVWVAGGIGITPFLSMLRAEARVKSLNSITFFYCHKEDEGSVFAEEIKYLRQYIPHLRLVDWCSGEKPRLSAQTISQYAPPPLYRAVFLCGPPAMMESLVKQFTKLGVTEENLIFENFSFT